MATVKIVGDQAPLIQFHDHAGRTHTWDPNEFGQYDDNVDDFLLEPYALPAKAEVVNGSFEQPLGGHWRLGFCQDYDDSPFARQALVKGDAAKEEQFLRLHVMRTKKQSSPSGSLLADARQAVKVYDDRDWPQIRFAYRIPADGYASPSSSSGRVRVDGYSFDKRVFSMFYWIGDAQPVPREKIPPDAHLATAASVGQWTRLALNVRSDLAAAKPKLDWQAMNVDRIVLTIAAHNMNKFENNAPKAELILDLDDVAFELLKQDPQPSAGFQAAQPTIDK